MPWMIADFLDILISHKLLITPDNPISPLNAIVIPSKIVRIIVKANVNIVSIHDNPVINIIEYAGICISFTTIFTFSISSEFLFFPTFVIKIIIALTNAITNIINKINNSKYALF